MAKAIMVVTANTESPDHSLVSVEDDHPVVGFCERWQASGEAAWIDMGNDEPDLISMGNDLIQAEGSKSFPASVDYVVHLAVY